MNQRLLLSLIILTACLTQRAIADEGRPMSAEEYIETYKALAIREMLLYNIPASITMAQGMLESGNGNSRLAREANNHFGIKCHTGWEGPRILEDDDAIGECFRVYDDPEASYRDHSIFLSTRSRYADLFTYKRDDYKSWAKGLKAAGYATNPKYPELLITRIEKYGLAALDTFTVIPVVVAVPEPDLADNLDREPGTGIPRDPETTEVRPEGAYDVYIFNNVRCVDAHEGDTPAKLSAYLDLMFWQVTRYNDVEDTYTFREGERVYLQPKRNKGSEKTHQVTEGETLRIISQLYGVKQKKLMHYNNLEEGQELVPGMVLQLRHKAR